MDAQQIRKDVQDALAVLSGGEFMAVARDLLKALGYDSKLTLNLSGDVNDFISALPAQNSNTKSEKVFCTNAKSVHIIFQITDDEIAASAQNRLFDTVSSFDKGNNKSFIFVTVELNDASYSRGKYALFTREINKRLSMPTVVLFKTTDDRLTLAFVHRRPHKRDGSRDVLGNVSLIREIHTQKPHRAHIDILTGLALENRLQWMNDHGKSRNFDGLLAAWLDALDTEELNRRFYGELFCWFKRAVSEATFPSDEKKTLDPEEHVIRLITRLLFIWFIKEKGLVAEELFIEKRISPLLRDYNRDDGDSYYRVVLQNLFFATLNTEIDKRRFSKKSNDTHRNFSCYRYKKEISDPNDLLLLFAQTPFINGGLFDCLDSEVATRAGGWRIDCFSDVQYHKLSIPNCLFFDNKGLIPLFNRYKFTVEENTPAEREVALDPELLGKVFENLLAAYNPETRETARKQTGSYYTPRPVVDYMVDESLVEMLAEKSQPSDGEGSFWRDRLRYLLDYEDAFNDANELFNEAEKKSLVEAIAGIKMLDPAVGSGAFLMGVLHKLTLVLRRLDSNNQLWEMLQKELAGQRAASAFDTQNQQERDVELAEISDTFEHYRDSDFGRKLYLIQNSIFGVDIQPIACQIAKLRFFISLAIEQEPTNDATGNYGIKPLPNLETRFIAANTLLDLGPRMLISGKAQSLERELHANRERHFHATTRQKKLNCRKQDKKLRADLAKELKHTNINMPASDVNKIANWDPYDQNAKADWFDAWYMFGVDVGFDVVIANPPYINVENLSAKIRSHLFSNYQACKKRTDIYIAFLEKSLSILNSKGLMCFIIPAAFTKQQYGTKMRQILINNHFILQLVDASSYRIFENAVVNNVVLVVAKNKRDALTQIRLHQSNADFENRTGIKFSVDQTFFASLKDCRFDTNSSIADYIEIKEKIWHNAIRFDRICFVAYGARLNHSSEKKKIGKSHYVSTSPISGGKRFCEGRNIERYSFSQDGWLNYTPDEHCNPMFSELFENPKLMFINIIKDRPRFAYDGEGFYNSHTVTNCVRLDLLLEASHTSAVRAVKSADIAIAKQFNYKFLLAVLNSQFTSWYFHNFLSEKLHFYTNDAKELPIPKISATKQRPFIRLVDSILVAKASAQSTDVSKQEAEIDRLIYALYGLTTEEISVVEGSV